MTAPPPTEEAGWDDRLLIEAADVARRFPGVVVWFGVATRRWWALVLSAGRWRLVEARRLYDLSQVIASASVALSRSGKASPVVAPGRSGRRSKGRHARAARLGIRR